MNTAGRKGERTFIDASSRQAQRRQDSCSGSCRRLCELNTVPPAIEAVETHAILEVRRSTKVDESIDGPLRRFVGAHDRLIRCTSNAKAILTDEGDGEQLVTVDLRPSDFSPDITDLSVQSGRAIGTVREGVQVD